MKPKRVRRNYAKLEGRKCVYDNGMHSFNGVVTGADYAIGITIQEDGNLSRYLMCLNGPKSPFKINPRGYPKVARYVYDSVMSGKRLDSAYILEIFRTVKAIIDNNPSVNTCVFSQ